MVGTYGVFKEHRRCWGCNVYVQQDVDGNVQAVDVQKCNVDDSPQGKMHLETQ